MRLRIWQIAVLALGLFQLGSSMAANLPTVDEVQQAAHAGRLNQAESMIEQVIAQRPTSAHAHFVAAEIYAKEGKISVARSELQKAEQLAPSLPFASPHAVSELKALTGAASGSTFSAPGPEHSAFPWGMVFVVVGAIAVIAMIIRSLGARSAPQAAGYPNGMPGQAYPGYGGGYAPAPPGGGMGSGILGGLATGAAVGAGMVAGEALAHHFIDGERPAPAQDSWVTAQNDYDMGGQNFGITDGSSWDDGTNVADSSGGDDWT